MKGFGNYLTVFGEILNALPFSSRRKLIPKDVHETPLKSFAKNIVRHYTMDLDIININNQTGPQIYTLEFYGDLKKITDFEEFQILKKIMITELHSKEDEM